MKHHITGHALLLSISRLAVLLSSKRVDVDFLLLIRMYNWKYFRYFTFNWMQFETRTKEKIKHWLMQQKGLNIKNVCRTYKTFLVRVNLYLCLRFCVNNVHEHVLGLKLSFEITHCTKHQTLIFDSIFSLFSDFPFWKKN